MGTGSFPEVKRLGRGVDNSAPLAKGKGKGKGKDKAVPLQACSDPEGSRKLKFPDFMITAQDGGKFVSLTPRKYTWYSFLLEAESTPGP
jgi:hypothetical protein